MESYKNLLLNNQLWAQEKMSVDSEFFTRMAKDQKPDYLWIGCSDSRVPSNEITRANPGEIFVHRNIANMACTTDLNFMSVLEYAVDFLKVKHVIVCGHYGCGGVAGAISGRDLGALNPWLVKIKDVINEHTDILRPLDPETKFKRVVELNIQEQVENLMKTSVIQRAWKNRGGPFLHGWVYDLQDGLLKELTLKTPEVAIEGPYKFNFEGLGS